MTNVWTLDLTLNHELLDPQHVVLFKLLEEACAAAEPPFEALSPALARFAEGLVAHLASEEQLMTETRYPERARHKASHDLLVADVVGLQQELAHAGPTPRLAEAVRTRIPEWLRYHTRVNDVPFGEFLARHARGARSEEPPRARPRKPS